MEILLVLVVLSLVSIAVISSLPPSSSRKEHDDVQAVYQRIQLLQEDAILSSRAYGVFINDVRHSIEFLSNERGRWQPVPKTMMNSDLKLSDDVSVNFQPGGSVWLNKERLYFPEERQEPMQSYDDGKEKIQPPQIVIYSNGMITPFRLSFSRSDGVSSSVFVTENGQLKTGDQQ